MSAAAAMASPPRVWPKRATPATARMPVEVTVPELARACGLSRQTMLRRLQDYEVVLHKRGRGKNRDHWVVTIAELRTSRADWILAAIDWNVLLLERAKRPSASLADDDEE